MRNIDREWAGRYRNSNVIIGGATQTPPEAFEVPGLMQELLNWAGSGGLNLHPVEAVIGKDKDLALSLKLRDRKMQ